MHSYRRLQILLILLCVTTIVIAIGAFWLRAAAVDDNIARVKKEADARIAAVQAEAVARDLTSCRVQNTFRKHDLETWTYILGLATPRTAASKAQSARFRAFITAKDAPVACLAVSQGKPTSTSSIPALPSTTRKAKP